jgi:hypothetical protein
MATKDNGPVRILTERSAASERGRYITPPSHLTGKMHHFDYRKHAGIKSSHVWAFTETCRVLNVVVLVRATNPSSIQWMEKKGYAAKPIDCKAKTADISIDVNGSWVECAGLVVSPVVLGHKVFGKKLEKAEKAWRDFQKGLLSRKLENGTQVFLRHERKGFYAVDTDPYSSHFGCLVVSEQMPPNDFDPSKSHIRKWMGINMSYLHGDYDLYGIIDNSEAAAMTPGKVHVADIYQGSLLGQKSFTTALSKEVEQNLNLLMGAEMVKHGEQSAYEHIASDVYIFYPSGNIQVVLESQFKHSVEMENYFQDVYRYVFKTAYRDQDEGVRESDIRRSASEDTPLRIAGLW